MKNSIQVVTHNGVFHSDEIFAIALLSSFYEVSNIHRTRDRAELTDALKDDSVFVLDVGGEFNPGMGNFDHHMSTFTEVNSFGNKLSTAGLILAHLEENFDVPNVEQLRKFVNIIDMQDNGVERNEMLAVYGTLNSHPDGFNVALELAKNHLVALNAQWSLEEAQYLTISKGIANMEGGVVFLDQYAPISEELTSIEEAMVVVFPSQQGDAFMIKTLPALDGDSFSMRCPLPEEWRGLSGEKLKSVSGLPLGFVHAGGFIGNIEVADEDGAIAIAKVIVDKVIHS